MASSTSSSPLFDQPFAEIPFPNGNVDATSRQQLRRRENDSVVQRGDPATTPLFASSSSATNNNNAPYYYSHTPRKRKSGIDKWVPRMFKAILWSPVVVVAIWGMSSMLFTRTTVGKRARGNTASTVQVRPTSSSNGRTAKLARQSQTGGTMMTEGGMVVAEVLESALGKEQPPGMLSVVTPLGNSNPQRTGNRFTNFMRGVTHMVRPNAAKSSSSSMVVVQPANLYPQQQQPVMGATGGNGGGGVYMQPNADGTYQQQPNMGSSSSNGGGVYMQPNADGTYGQQQQQQPNMGSNGGGGGGVYMQPNADGTYGQQQQPNMGSSGGNGGGVYMQPNADGTYGQQQQQQPNMGSSNSGGGVYMQPNADGTYSQQQQQPNMGSSSNSGGGVYMQPSADGTYSQQQPNMGNSNGGGGVYMQPNSDASAQDQPSKGSSNGGVYYEGIYQQPNADGTAQQPQMQAVGPSHLRGSTQYLYYNPRDVVVMDGQVYLPSQAFDSNGKAHDLSRSNAQLYFQPPPLYGDAGSPSSAGGSSTTNTMESPVRGQSSPEKTMSIPKNITQVDTNSSILVATVGVIALLVGALSARHARGRACLNSCLENENLVASEAAYDTAHTTANSYSTFWKGDLEKFDV